MKLIKNQKVAVISHTHTNNKNEIIITNDMIRSSGEKITRLYTKYSNYPTVSISAGKSSIKDRKILGTMILENEEMISTYASYENLLRLGALNRSKAELEKNPNSRRAKMKVEKYSIPAVIVDKRKKETTRTPAQKENKNMKQLQFNICDYETKEEITTAAKEMLLNAGYTVIQSSPEYFTYMLDDKFASFQASGYGLAGASISSSYHPGKQCGTGCGYKESYIFTLEDFEKALNFTLRGFAPVFFTDLQDYLSNHWNIFKTTVYTKNGEFTGLEMLENYFVFISSEYAPVIDKSHFQLERGIYQRVGEDTKKAIFVIKGGAVEVLNHNIDLFSEHDIFQGFKNRLQGVK